MSLTTHKTISIFLKRLLPIKSLISLSQPQKHNDPLIDGLRGLSVLMVVWFHSLYAVHFGFDADFFQNFLSQFPTFLRFVMGTDKAVDIFFMISAFLLGCSLRRYYMNDHLSMRAFYIQRIMRIYPLFLIALALYSFTVRSPLAKLPANLIFIDNFTHQTIIPVGWSLSVEMQCYLALPLIVILAHKMTRPLLMLWVLFAATVFVRLVTVIGIPESYTIPFTYFVTGKADSSIYMNTLYYSTTGRVSSFVIGLIWAYSLHNNKLIENIKTFTQNPVRSNLAFIILFAVLLSTMYFPVYLADSSYYQNYFSDWNFSLVWLHRVIFVLALLALVLMLQKGNLRGILSWVHQALALRTLRILSRLAFPIYLFHFPFVVVGWLAVLQTTNLDSISQITLMQTVIAAFITMLCVTWFSLPLHFLIEKKGVLLGKRWAKQFTCGQPPITKGV